MNEAIAGLVRRHDPDRFLTAMFAPADRRDALLVLYGFNHELARAREVVSEPPLALIRLQWWREVVEGQPKRHEVASPLFEVIQSHDGQLAGDLAQMIDGREQEVEAAFETVADWRAAILLGGGGLAVAAARLLGAAEPEGFRRFGGAYAIAGQVRATRYLAAQGRCLLPGELLRRQGLTFEDAIADPDSLGVRDVLSTLVQEGSTLLASCGSIQRAAHAAALPATLARRDFARWRRQPGNVALVRGLGDKLAVVRAAIIGRV